MSEETNYNIFCIDEQLTLNVWSVARPICCPNNYRHSIDPLQTVKLSKRYTDVQIVKIQEENNPTNGNFRYESFKYHLNSNGETVSDICFPYPISILGVSTVTTEIQRGDKLNVSFIPAMNTIGTLTQPLHIGESNMYVTPSVINYMNPGHVCIINNIASNTSNNLGEVSYVNISSNMIITQYAASNDFNALTPVQIHVKAIKNMEFTEPMKYAVGERKIGASYIPAKTKIRMTYSNASSNLEKDMVMSMEYLY